MVCSMVSITVLRIQVSASTRTGIGRWFPRRNSSGSIHLVISQSFSMEKTEEEWPCGLHEGEQGSTRYFDSRGARGGGPQTLDWRDARQGRNRVKVNDRLKMTDRLSSGHEWRRERRTGWRTACLSASVQLCGFQCSLKLEILPQALIA